MQIAVYPGTFDPITNGHIDVIKRAARIFDKLIVAIAHNPGKTPFFDIKKRIALAEQALAGMDNITIISFDNLLVDCARENKAQILVRGLRAVSDFEFEVQLSGMNRRLNPEVETVFIAAAQEHAFVSSSLVREIARLHGDVTEFVPLVVKQALDKRLG